MVFLDTHIVAWLYDNKMKFLSKKAIETLEKEELFISPLVILELEYLYEIKKIKVRAHTIIEFLVKNIALKIDNTNLLDIINMAIKETWTRDPFDRLIVAQAKYNDAQIISKDEKIRQNYPKSIF